METGQAQALLDDWMQRLWFERETVTFAVPVATPKVQPAELVRLPDLDADLLITETEDGSATKVTARKVLRSAPALWRLSQTLVERRRSTFAGRPLVVILDLPLAPGQTAAQDQLRVAAVQEPWRPQAVFVSPEASGYALRSVAGQEATIGRLAGALSAGVEGRVDHSQTIEVDLLNGELASTSRAQLLNGANVAAIQSTSGAWEVIQFETAEEIAPDRWRLAGLLRAQLGTDDAMLSGVPADGLFVLLDAAVTAVGLSASEVGLTLNWRIGPSGAAFTDIHFVTIPQAGGARARLPLSPVHLNGALNTSGDIEFSWIRRSRIDADDWDGLDVPLGEAGEQYQVEVRSTAGVLKRVATVPAATWTYEAAEIAFDFGSVPSHLDLSVRQVGEEGGPGITRTQRISL